MDLTTPETQLGADTCTAETSTLEITGEALTSAVAVLAFDSSRVWGAAMGDDRYDLQIPAVRSTTSPLIEPRAKAVISTEN